MDPSPFVRRPSFGAAWPGAAGQRFARCPRLATLGCNETTKTPGYRIRRWEVDRLSQLQGPRFAWIFHRREQRFPFACMVNSLGIRAESSARHLPNHIQWRMNGERIHEKQSEFRAKSTSCTALSQHAGSGALPGALPAHAREVASHWAGTALHQRRSAMLVSPRGSRRLGGSRNARVHIAESGGKCLSSWPVESRASGI